ncbi:MAG: RIO-type serine/threonine-protein kinase Rio1 [Promethearchaeota archaeon]|nr:MAG: RIO-type serine/threonine-protein kinase Rio1 [Candidatus Lokiarchaeota archaeon]
MENDDEIEEELEENINHIEKHLSSFNIEDMEKEGIDKRRIKKKDFSKKRAAVESVFDERTAFQLSKIIINRQLDSVEGIISAGKEANVYLGYDTDNNEVAIKIYKIDRNTSKWMKNYITGDPRFKRIPKNISKIIYLWANKEFKNLKRADKAGLRVPKPIYVKNNILIMEYIGEGPNPAPRLKDVRNPEKPDELLEESLYFIKHLYQDAKLVHGDLSEFNILYQDVKPIFIDISQAVSIDHPKAEIYLVRDIKNMFNYFESLAVETPNPKKFYYEIIE